LKKIIEQTVEEKECGENMINVPQTKADDISQQIPDDNALSSFVLTEEIQTELLSEMDISSDESESDSKDKTVLLRATKKILRINNFKLDTLFPFKLDLFTKCKKKVRTTPV